jgi:uncharacterized protein (DUF1330 family)
MQNKKATIVVEGTFRLGHEQFFEEYSNKIRTFLKQYQATIIRRQLITEILYGQEMPDLIMLIDFENIDVAKKIFFDKQYAAIIPLRDKVFKDFKMYIAEFGSV